ncbi:hypothetical protein [Streptomyces sp. NPDC001401]|uniref:hypothetical protein n=1 Tax=Streptomyces sp. NPDC001401 TaxID=3364570 RepID=UPI0036AFB5A3
MRGVVLITGVMAAGESTAAQALAEELPRAAHVRGDVFRRTRARPSTPRLGLWLDSSELTVGETVEAILAGRERARVC